MNLATWNAEATRLLAVDRTHRAAKQSGLLGRQLLPVGRISRFLTVCFAILVGSLMLMPVAPDVPGNVVVLTAVLLTTYAPFADVWGRFTDFERLHAPPAGLLLFRLRRLLPLLSLIGAVWAGSLFVSSDNGFAIAAVGLMPIVMNLAHLLRSALASLGMRAAIAASFVLGWMHLVEWATVVTLVLQVGVVVWFVRDLGAYDREGFELQEARRDHTNWLRDEIARQRPLPNVRAAKRRSLIGSAWFANLAAQRDLYGLWQRRPLTVTLANLMVVALWLAPVWLAVIGVWSSVDGVSVIWCLLAALLSMSLLKHERSAQLYLWGVDMRELERHNVIVRLLTVALPSTGAAALAAVLLGASEAGWASVLLVAGAHLAYVGIKAFNGATRLLLTMAFGLAFGILIASSGTAWSPDVARMSAYALAGFGMLGIAIHLTRSEEGLRQNAFA